MVRIHKNMHNIHLLILSTSTELCHKNNMLGLQNGPLISYRYDNRLISAYFDIQLVNLY